jgi:hypothetical protein
MDVFAVVQSAPLLVDAAQVAAVLDAAARDVMPAAEVARAAEQLAARPGGLPVKRLLTLLEMAAQVARDERPAEEPGPAEGGAGALTAAGLLRVMHESDA